MSSIIEKLKGDGAALPPKASPGAIMLAWLGGFIAIAAIAGLFESTAIPLVLGSFGASCVLVFGYPDVPFSQPRNVVVGHFLSSLSGLVFVTLCGPHWWSVAIAVATAIALMMATRTVHPPAGSNPVIIYLLHPGWSFLLTPTLAGSLILVLVAVLYNNASREGRYPKYW